MTNGEKYKTVKERTKAFTAFCDSHSLKCEECPIEKACSGGTTVVGFTWLDLEAEEEKPLPCPFCENIPTVNNIHEDLFTVSCVSEACGYFSCIKKTRDEAIAAHNRVARAVMAAKDKEAK